MELVPFVTDYQLSSLADPFASSGQGALHQQVSLEASTTSLVDLESI
jgi:hypothetical protein